MTLPAPDYARNMRLVGHSDQGGRPDALQVMVNRGFAYVAHPWSQGFSIIDVRDPKNPGATVFVPAPANTWTIHLQTHDDLLLVVHARDDSINLFEIGARLGETIPQAEFLPLDTGGHLLLGHHADLRDRIAAFLNIHARAATDP